MTLQTLNIDALYWLAFSMIRNFQPQRYSRLLHLLKLKNKIIKKIFFKYVFNIAWINVKYIWAENAVTHLKPFFKENLKRT